MSIKFTSREKLGHGAIKNIIFRIMNKKRNLKNIRMAVFQRLKELRHQKVIQNEKYNLQKAKY